MSKIYYLAHPYSRNPEESVKNAMIWTYQLKILKGLNIFSRVLHTHYFHRDYIIKNDMVHPAENIDYVEWDLRILEAFGKNVILLLSNTAYEINEGDFMDLVPGHQVGNWFSEGCKKEYEFAKLRNIEILELESFLEGEEVHLY